MALRASQPRPSFAQESEAVELTQVARALELYLRALLQMRVTISGIAQPAASLWSRLFRRPSAANTRGGPPVSSYTDGAVLYLPVAIELSPRRDDNLRLYKCLALLCAAQILQGTLNYVRWFVPSAEKRVALDLFALLENDRLERGLGAELKGLAADLDALRRQSWEERPPVAAIGSKDAVVETLVQRLLRGTARQRVAPARRGVLDEMWEKITRRSPAGTADVARLALELAEDLGRVPGAYHALTPVLHWPRLRPELVLAARRGTSDQESVGPGRGAPRQSGEARAPSEVARPTNRPGGGVPLRGALPRDLTGARASEGPRDPHASDQDERLMGGARPVQHPHSLRAVEPSGRRSAGEASPRDWTDSTERRGEDGVFVYDEWDYRAQTYRRGTCLLRQEPLPQETDPESQARIEAPRGVARQIRRQFELMRPERRRRKRELDGETIDLEAVVEAVADRRAGHPTDGRLYIARAERDRDIAVALLVDLSSSTEAWVKDVRRVVEVEREALRVIGPALEAVGDSYAIFGFSSKVEKGCVFYRIKSFGERHGPAVQSRIGMLTGRGYTRMGVPIRHATRILSSSEARLKLLLVLSDGKPNEVGIYQGRYAVEDTRQAVLEARHRGIFPFGLTIERGDRRYLPRIFGPRGYAVVDDVLELPVRLAEIYRRLTT